MSQALQSRKIEIRVPALHSGQQKIVKDAARFNVLACGRRFGKTTLGIELDIQPALDGFPVAWFSPTYKMMGEVWRDTRKILSPITRQVNAQEHRLELITGGIIDMWSLDSPDSTRGRKYKRVVVDEAAMVPNFQEAWQAAIRPTLTDFKGDAYWLSTPKGMNFFKQGFDYGQDPLMPDWASWQMPTTENPYISKDEVEKARQELPELTFKQEYLAEFLQSEGAVFRNIEANLTAPANASPEAHRGHRVVSGLDWAQKHDFTAHSIGCADCKVELELDRFNKIEWAFQRARIKNAIQRWHINTVLAEENSIGSPNIEALQNEDLPIRAFATTSATKGPLIQSLALAFERMEIRWLNNPVGTAELVAYESKVSSVTGRASYSAPEGMNDDTVIARALMNHAAQQRVEVDDSYSYGYREY
jgi:phage terminase large subunit-like protein